MHMHITKTGKNTISVIVKIKGAAFQREQLSLGGLVLIQLEGQFDIVHCISSPQAFELHQRHEHTETDAAKAASSHPPLAGRQLTSAAIFCHYTILFPFVNTSFMTTGIFVTFGSHPRIHLFFEKLFDFLMCFLPKILN